MLRVQTQSFLQWIKVKKFITNDVLKTNLNYSEKKAIQATIYT